MAHFASVRLCASFPLPQDFYAGVQESTRWTDATIPLLSIVTLAFLLGVILLLWLKRCTPKPASRAIEPREQRFGQRAVRNPTLVGAALMFQVVLLALLGVVIGLNAWTHLTWNIDFGQMQWRFGVYFVVIDKTGVENALTAWYSCALEPKATGAYERTCRTFRVGTILVMIYEGIFALAGVTAMILLIIGSYRQKFTAAAYEAQAITCLAAGAATLSCKSEQQQSVNHDGVLSVCLRADLCFHSLAVSRLFAGILCVHIVIKEQNVALVEALTVPSSHLRPGVSWLLLLSVTVVSTAMLRFWFRVIEAAPSPSPAVQPVSAVSMTQIPGQTVLPQRPAHVVYEAGMPAPVILRAATAAPSPAPSAPPAPVAASPVSPAAAVAPISPVPAASPPPAVLQPQWNIPRQWSVPRDQSDEVKVTSTRTRSRRLRWSRQALCSLPLSLSVQSEVEPVTRPNPTPIQPVS